MAGRKDKVKAEKPARKPLGERLVSLLRGFFETRQPYGPGVLKPYIREMQPWQSRLGLLFAVGALGVFGLVYGFFYALTTPFLLVPFMIPLGVLLLLVIWALPDTRNPPVGGIERAFFLCVVSLVVWPNYLAIDLPGLPWITMIRLFGFPMVFFLLVCLSTSRSFRTEVGAVVNSAPVLWKILLGFVALQFLTVPLSHEMGSSLSKSLVQQVSWTAMFFVGCWVFTRPGRAETWVNLFFFSALLIALDACWEVRLQHLPWADHVPSFLKVDQDSGYLSSSARTATGQYRAKGTSSTPLGLAELMALAMPFALHIALNKYHWVKRLLGALCVPLFFYVVRLTDSRLGVVGSITTILGYGGLWSFIRWRQNKSDVLGPAIMVSFPFFFTAMVVATFTVHRLHVMVFGDGATAASNQSRKTQLSDGIVKVAHNPIGHGTGQSGDVLGFRGSNGILTVDNYMLTLALDYGVLGLLLFVTFFAMGGFRAVRETLKAPASPDRELNLFPALATMILNFLVIKLVFSQVENHSLLFMVMGMIVALSYRRAQEAKVAQTSRAVVMTQAASAAPSRGRQPAYARAGLDPAAISRAPRVR